MTGKYHTLGIQHGWVITEIIIPNQPAVLKTVQALHPIKWEPVIVPPIIPNKDRRATDNCFSFVGAHHRGILMVCWNDWVPSVCHTDEPQQGQNSCLWPFHLPLIGQSDHPLASLNTVSSAASWLGAIIPVITQTFLLCVAQM